MNTIDFSALIPEGFSGCMMVSNDQGILCKKAFGYANLPNRIQNRTTTRFATASAGKFFVAIGVLRLIEQGKLSLDSTIGHHLDFDLQAIDPKITIEQLLTHTSGIPDYFNEQIMDDYSALWRDYPNYKIRTSADLIPLFIHKPMMYPRGARFQYNNTGYVVLGLMIESVTGKSFDAYLKEAVFLPSGMSDTGYFELDRLPERCADAYLLDEATQTYYTNIYSVDVKGTGAGGAFTTVHDIDHLWKALYKERLLSESTLEAMMRFHAGSKTEYYGYGVWLQPMDKQTFIPYFEGRDPGVSFISKRHDTGTIITVVSNKEQNVWQIVRNIEKAMKE